MVSGMLAIVLAAGAGTRYSATAHKLRAPLAGRTVLAWSLAHSRIVIGAAIVAEFAAQGYDIVLNYNSGKDRAEAIAGELRQRHGVEVLTAEADLSTTEAPFQLVDQAYGHFGRLDVLVCSAGITGPNTTVRDYPVDAWQRVIDVNLTGAYLCARAFAPGMVAKAASRRARSDLMTSAWRANSSACSSANSAASVLSTLML